MLVGEWVKFPQPESDAEVFERIGIGEQDDSVSPTKSGLSLTDADLWRSEDAWQYEP